MERTLSLYPLPSCSTGMDEMAAVPADIWSREVTLRTEAMHPR